MNQPDPMTKEHLESIRGQSLRGEFGAHLVISESLLQSLYRPAHPVYAPGPIIVVLHDPPRRANSLGSSGKSSGTVGSEDRAVDPTMMSGASGYRQQGKDLSVASVATDWRVAPAEDGPTGAGDHSKHRIHHLVDSLVG